MIEQMTLTQPMRLQLHCDVPDALSVLEKEIAGLHQFIQYFEPDEYSFQADAVDVMVSRIQQHMLAAGEEMTEMAINDVLTGEQAADTPAMQRILNLERAMQLSSSFKKPGLTVGQLQQIHKQLTLKMPNAHCAGLLRTKSNSLFANMETGIVLPEGSHLNQLLDDTLKLTTDKKKPILLRCWMVYYSLISIQPFYDENEAVAILACRQMLEAEGVGFFGLLNLEKHIFFDSKYLLQTKHLLKEQSIAERINADITEFAEVCLEGLKENLTEIKSKLVNQARRILNYDSLNPRQKNNMNFWLELGFFRHSRILQDLSGRQHEIIILMSRYISLATKDLVPVFRVDRKTIQRDFTELAEKGIVEMRGAGRNLRYIFDFRFSY